MRRHLLALVLAFALVWHTALVPAYVPAVIRVSGGGPREGDGREAEPAEAREFAPAPEASLPGTARPARRPPAGEIDNLEWPEIIGGD